MKRLLLTLTVFCCALIVSCKKDNKTVVNDLFIGAFKQGNNWVAKPSTGIIPSTDSLQVQGFKQVGEENLIFKIKFTGKGTYSLKGAQATYFTTLGMDAITSNYKLDDTQTNTVTVNSFNVATGIASGTFEMNFLRTYGSGDAKISFTGGKFYIYVPN